jgi:hypothetical protein
MGVIETVDIIADLVANTPLVIDFKTVVDNGNGTYTLTICGDDNFLYLKVLSKITINSIVYTVTAISGNSITLKGSVVPPIGKVTLPALKFYNGSIMQTKAELTRISDVGAKTPMVYLKRTFNERWNSEEDANEREADVNLFFLTQANYSEWQTSQHDINAVKPMRNVMYAFISYLRKNKHIGLIEDYTTVDRIKFGVITDKSNAEFAYWDDNLSGVELAINLPIGRNYECKC